MKSGPPKKRKTSAESKSGNGDSGDSMAASGQSVNGPPAEVSARGSSGSSGTKQGRRNREKQTRPPVRIVSDLSSEAEAIPDNLSSEHIAQRAYELYAASGYEPGKEVEHWLEAERQLKAEHRKRKRS
jgi:hypothetical protein